MENELKNGAGNQPCVRWHKFDTPLGEMRVASLQGRVSKVSVGAESDADYEDQLCQEFSGMPLRDSAGLSEVERQIMEYFDGERRDFDLPLDTSSLTPFQKEVLDTVSSLEFGITETYGGISRMLHPEAANGRYARAVGGALGSNPLPILIPCHRVLGTTKSSGGYAWGLPAKRLLLHHERLCVRLEAGNR